ncbi:hypothetical protein [Flavobacterium crassostreae]|uniref:Uncharacterized protein n=1 Tax=Flavobacterium crassostreae TaxID=1763534 RepID=A0A1B9E5M9_9FLAO|nr:hypothetical protein [Flavobacterium crassostreae]OCB77229.1 hypothetical protein LPBF_04310 [Flavobacterium crassostreae]
MQAFLNFIKYLIPFSLVLFLSQYLIVTTAFGGLTFFYSIWSIYLFHIGITLLSYFFLLLVHTTLPEKTGFSFMAISLLKMLAAVVFLIPLLQSEITSKIGDVALFFVPYFFYLFFETFFAIRLINKH